MSFIHFSGLSGKSLLYAQGIPHSPFNKSFRSWMQQPLWASAGKRSADVRPCWSHLQAPVKLISPILKNRLAQSLASFPSALFFHQKPLDPSLCSLPSLQRTWFSFGLALVGDLLQPSRTQLAPTYKQHAAQKTVLPPLTCLPSSQTCIYNVFNCCPPEAEIPRASSSLEDWPPPPSHIQNITSHTLVKHLMVAKRWISSRRKTGNLPLKTGHLKIDKMLSCAVYHWHTAWNLKQIMLWTSNTSLKIENILLASVVCSFWLLTLGV